MTIQITKLRQEIIIRYNQELLQLPVEIQCNVDNHWERLMSTGKTYHRGEVFTVTEVTKSKNTIEVLVKESDFAHYMYSKYLYSKNRLSDADSIKVIHTSAVVETSDGYFIFGQMASNTSAAGMYQLSGGGLDNNDLEKGRLNHKHNIQKELLEELGIDVLDASRVAIFEPFYFTKDTKTGLLAVIYKILLRETKEVFLNKYYLFEKDLLATSNPVEFSKVITLRKNKKVVQDFLRKNAANTNSTMRALLLKLVSKNLSKI